jgi:hypothetical protein
MDFTRPTVSFEPIDLPIYNSTIKLAGKYSVGAISHVRLVTMQAAMSASW